MPFDPNSATLVNSGFDPSSAKLVEQPTQSAQPVVQAQPKDNSDQVMEQAVSPIIAAEAGFGNFGASVGESAIDAASYVANKLGLSDSKADTIKIAANMGANDIRTNPNASGNLAERSLAANPYVGMAAQYIPAARALASSALPNIIKGAGALSAVANTGIRALGNAIVGSGISGPNKESQDQGATYSAALTPIGDLAVAGATKLATALNLPQKLQQYVKPIYDKIKSAAGLSIEDRAVQAEGAYTKAALDQNNANYQKIKDIPGQISPQPIQSNVLNFAKSTGMKFDTSNGGLRWIPDSSTLSKEQVSVLQNVWQDASNMKNMEDAVQLRQYITANKPLFQGSTVNKPTFNFFKELKSNLDNAIGSKASEAGLGDAWDQANKFNQNVVQPLNESGATDRLSALNKKASQETFNAQQQPGQPQASIPPEYTQATKQIFQANMSPQKVKEVLSRLGPDGSQIMQDHFVQSTFKDLMANPENFDKNTALIKVNNITEKYKDVLSTDTLKTFEGIKTVLREAGAIAKKTPSDVPVERYAGHVIGGLIGGSVGGYEGYEHGGGVGSAIGSVAGAALGVGAFNLFKHGLVDTAPGQALLRHLANNPKSAREVISALIQSPAANFNNQNENLAP